MLSFLVLQYICYLIVQYAPKEINNYIQQRKCFQGLDQLIATKNFPKTPISILSPKTLTQSIGYRQCCHTLTLFFRQIFVKASFSKYSCLFQTKKKKNSTSQQFLLSSFRADPMEYSPHRYYTVKYCQVHCLQQRSNELHLD